MSKVTPEKNTIRQYAGRQTAILLLTVLCCAAALVLWLQPAKDPVSADQTAAAPALRPVTVKPVVPRSYAATIDAAGEALPQWETNLKSPIEGLVLSVSADLKPGCRVHKNQILVTLESSAYDARVAQAEARLAAAKVQLLTQTREAREARLSWQRSGLPGKPASPLVLRQPQLDAAAKELAAARSTLARARQELRYTRIRAPFDGIVGVSHVDPGEMLLPGDAVATIIGTDRVVIALPLDAVQWARLPRRWQGAPATVHDPLQDARWPATIVRRGGRLDGTSRLRTLYLEVERPFDRTPPLLPGTFVQVNLPGEQLPDLLCLPESALTRKGDVWYVDAGNRLQRFAAGPVFRRDGSVYVRAPESAMDGLHVVLSPTLNAIAGTRVQPTIIDAEE